MRSRARLVFHEIKTRDMTCNSPSLRKPSESPRHALSLWLHGNNQKRGSAIAQLAAQGQPPWLLSHIGPCLQRTSLRRLPRTFCGFPMGLLVGRTRVDFRCSVISPGLSRFHLSESFMISAYGCSASAVPVDARSAPGRSSRCDDPCEAPDALTFRRIAPGVLCYSGRILALYSRLLTRFTVK